MWGLEIPGSGGTARTFGGRVAFPVPREVAFDYLADPDHRAQWQSSLARVADVRGEVGEGQSWTDVTKPGLQPRMRTTAYVRPRRWAEEGSWRFVRAELVLDFETAPHLEDGDRSRCTVAYQFRLHVLGPVGMVATLLAVPAVGADLRRAARLLASSGGQPR